ncbi:MAG: D-2-hydroxyacid dehydrogenase [Flavobacteriales bacterium]|nr:D-2-hydroxyacid dehydrogenase [Flavobacteriales bacterium]MCB9364991.1 D-2-hydroxyacid dehydrogenase [Flavobacteriales bacterium]
MKILANDGIAPIGKTQLEAAGFEVVTETVPQEQLIDAINNNNYVALLVRSATTARKDLIDACPNLKLIGRGGVGMDNIDVAYAREKGLHVINTPAASSQSVAEQVMAHLFGMARGLYDSNRQMPNGGNVDFKTLKKKYGKGIELRGKTLGILGIGRIGQATAKYALGCGMNVIAFDPFIDNVTINVQVANQTVSVDIKTISKDELLAQADFITLHIPAQADGKPVIGNDEFIKMKDGVMIVNDARGGVIDEDALIANLNSGKVAAAALDVYVNEPTPREDLMKHPKLSLTPHTGAATLEAQDRIGEELASQIKELLG